MTCITATREGARIDRSKEPRGLPHAIWPIHPQPHGQTCPAISSTWVLALHQKSTRGMEDSEVCRQQEVCRLHSYLRIEALDTSRPNRQEVFLKLLGRDRISSGIQRLRGINGVFQIACRQRRYRALECASGSMRETFKLVVCAATSRQPR